jgi:tRNA threonylcarbamoyl adenosine modification protein YjeE
VTGPERTLHLAHDEAQTEAIAAGLAATLEPGIVIALEGDLGAGKTRFVRGLAHGLGHDVAQVSSPTFVIEHRHATPGAVPLVHIDAYRLRGPADLEALGWDELLASGCAIVAVEWPSRIAAALPTRRVTVRLRDCGEGMREIEIVREGA